MVQLHNRTDVAKLAFDEAVAELDRQKAENDRRYQIKYEKLREERRQWDEEQAAMERLVATASSIVHLNVGGERISTTRSTLTAAEGSLLAAMFSGRMDHKLSKDTSGCIFLDYDPVLFKCLLNQLRTWTDPSVRRAIRPLAGSEQAFFDLLYLLKIDERFIDRDRSAITGSTAIGSPTMWQPETSSKGRQSDQALRFWTTNTSDVQLSDDDHRCEKISHDVYQCVFGTQTYSNGIHRIRLKLEEGTTNVFMGICSYSKTVAGQVYYNTPSVHGWFVHGYIVINGRDPQPGWSQVNENDIVEITINCERQTLRIYNERSGAKSSMEVNSYEAPLPWCLLVLFNLKHSRVSIV
ncbi:unnamed protein product [Adineta steineri]|uniref:Potassium channel tetramerisation-type BTB domain-containing protein n=1 Tax=Adineta steineri TaxID=433720 RepID=A0A815IHV5_9BILA|nr:unnamed protein product [Adineta steineri]CAF1601825.1 unnamed protein product [Adineta steineri]